MASLAALCPPLILFRPAKLSRKCLDARQIEAARKFRELYLQLAAARAELGDRHYRLLVSVVGLDHSLAEIAGNKRGRLTAIDNLRTGLDDLAGMWRLATRR